MNKEKLYKLMWDGNENQWCMPKKENSGYVPGLHYGSSAKATQVSATKK